MAFKFRGEMIDPAVRSDGFSLENFMLNLPNRRLSTASREKILIYKLDHYRLDMYGNRLYFGRKEVVSTDSKLLALLALLMEKYPATVEKSEIISSLWEGRVVTEASLPKVVSDLRCLLGDNSKSQRYIKTVHGRGYRLLVKPLHVAESHVSPWKWIGIHWGEWRRYAVLSLLPLFLLVTGSAVYVAFPSSQSKVTEENEPVAMVHPGEFKSERMLSRWTR